MPAHCYWQISVLWKCCGWKWKLNKGKHSATRPSIWKTAWFCTTVTPKKTKQHVAFPSLEDTFWNVTDLVLKSPNFHGLYQTQGIHWERWIEGQLRFLSWPGFIGKLEMWDRGQRGEVMKAMSQTRTDLINPHRLASHANNLQGILLHEPHIEAIGSNPVVLLTHHPTVFKSLACCLSVHLKPCILC